MSKLFGGQKSSSTTSNQAYGTLNNAFSGLLSNAATGMNGISSFLGGDTSGFNNYKDATGYDWVAENGSRGITANKAANSLLRSGSTGQALVDYGNNLQQTYAKDYLGQLGSLASLGLQAGNILANAGQTSKSKSSNKPGIGDFVMSGLSSVAISDPALKENVTKLDELEDGLGIYEFTYKHTGERKIGVMADEVEQLRPWALGPQVFGYRTVDYSKLKKG